MADQEGDRIQGVGYRTKQGPTSDADYNKLGEQADWDEFKKSRKLSFAANKAQYANEFADYRKQKAKASGQAKALGAVSPSAPAASPTPPPKPDND